MSKFEAMKAALGKFVALAESRRKWLGELSPDMQALVLETQAALALPDDEPVAKPEGWREFLTEIEWSNNRFADSCPICGEQRKHGHAEGCTLASMLAAAPQQGSSTIRKAFICNHCEGVYADSPVTSCDCADGTAFIEGVISYPAQPQTYGEPEACSEEMRFESAAYRKLAYTSDYAKLMVIDTETQRLYFGWELEEVMRKALKEEGK